MAFLDFITHWWTNSKIKSLENALQGHPTPAIYLQLADVYQKTHNSKKSAAILKSGAIRFPNVPEIVRRLAEAEKLDRKNEKKRLTDKMQTHPNPILYARLAELFKADGELDRTIDTCHKGIQVFPKYGGTYLVLGQIYAEKKQWQESASQLEKSVELDKYNYLALKLLAQVYMELNRPADAAQRLEDILYFAPSDEAILTLLKKAKEKAGQPFVRKTIDVAAELKPVAHKTILLGKLVAKQKESVVNHRDKQLNQGIAALRAVNGIAGAILMDQYGLVIASDLDASLDEGLAGALITNIYRAVSGNATKLNVGLFEEGLIESERGNIHIMRLDEMILAVFAKPDIKMGLLEKSIRDFAGLVVQSPS